MRNYTWMRYSKARAYTIARRQKPEWREIIVKYPPPILCPSSWMEWEPKGIRLIVMRDNVPW